MKTTKLRAAKQAARHARKAVEAAQMAEDFDAAEDTGSTMVDETTDDIRELLAGLPAEADLRLYRKSEQTGKLEYCESFPDPQGFTEEVVSQKWGPGSYRLIVKSPHPKTGKMVFTAGGSKVFNIAKRPAGAPTPATSSGKFEDSIAAQYSTMMLSQLQMMQQMMLQSQESHRAMLASMLTPRADPGLDIMKSLLPALLGKQSDPIETAARLAEIMRPVAAGGGSLSDQLEGFTKLLEIAKTMSGEAPDDPAWLQGIKTAVPLISQAMAARVPTPTGPGSPAATVAPSDPSAKALPAPGTVAMNPQAGQVAPAPAPTGSGLVGTLDSLMPALTVAAERLRPVDTLADFVVDQLTDDEIEALLAVTADASTAVDQLAHRYPAMAAHREWFIALIHEIHSGFSDEGGSDAPGAQDQPKPNDVGDSLEI